MFFDYLNRIKSYAYLQADRFAQFRKWKVLLAISMPFLVLFFSFPSYERLNTEFKGGYDALFQQAENPFAAQAGEGDHASKMAFRLFLPVLIKVLHADSIAQVMIIKAIFAFLTMFLFVYFLNRLTSGNHRIIIFLSISFISIAAGRSELTDIRGYIYEGESVLFLLAAMYFRHTLLVFLFVFFSSWCDERGLIASSLVFIYWLFDNTTASKKIYKLSAIVLSWVLYFTIRYYLINNLHFEVDTAAVSPFIIIDNMNLLPLSIWTAFEGMWIFVIASLILFYKKNKIEFTLYLGNILLIILVALCVWDVTRSLVYLFPAFIIAFRKIMEQENTEQIVEMSYYAMIFSLLFPAYSCFTSATVMWQYPLPLQILRYLFGGGT